MPASQESTTVSHKQRSGLYQRQAAAQLKRGQVQEASMGPNGPKTKGHASSPVTAAQQRRRCSVWAAKGGNSRQLGGKGNHGPVRSNGN